MISKKQFLNNLEKDSPKNSERVEALLWFISSTTDFASLTTNKLCKIIEDSGFSKQNISRINVALNKSKSVLKHGKGYKINPKFIESLADEYSKYSSFTPLKVITGLLDKELFEHTRGYIVKVVDQINISFDYGLYDCCAVMCRRLLETLIIEVYEHEGIENDIKDNDGNYLMFAGLLSKLENQTHFHIARNAAKALKDFKTLGDLSAHNRRFNARKSDITKIENGLRIAAEELLHLAELGV